MRLVSDEIRDLVAEALGKAFPGIKLEKIDINQPKDKKWGDYSSNVALGGEWAHYFGTEKELPGEIEKIGPLEIAEKIKELLAKNDWFEVTVAKPGFINFKLTDKYLHEQLKKIIEVGENFGESDWASDEKVLVEFISANPTGPLTLGNGRGGFMGDVLANCWRASGARVQKEYYINDTGNQVMALGHSVLKDDEAVYKGDYINELTQKIKGNGAEEVGKAAAYYIMEEYIRKTIAKMGIKFDEYFSEQSLYDSGEVAEVMGILKKNELIYEKDEATWLKTSHFGDDKDRVLIKEGGEYTYLASDLAYHFNKIKRGYNLLINLWGADHHGYVKRLKVTVDNVLRTELDWSGELDIIVCQLVRLVSGGKEVKMSKRAGEFVTLDELIDAVGLDVTRFFFLARSADTHMDFDLDLAKEHSMRNPVYYIQYALARGASIEREAEKQGLKATVGKLELLKEESELQLIRQLMRLPEVLEEVTQSFGVQQLTSFAYETAVLFHKFYEECRVIGEESEMSEARLAMVGASRGVIKKLLTLMGISSPEKMADLT